MFHCDRIALVLLLAPLASGQAPAGALPSQIESFSGPAFETGCWSLDAHAPFASAVPPSFVVRADELPAATEQVLTELHAPCALGIGALAALRSAPAAPDQEPADHAPFGVEDERFAQLLREPLEDGSTGSLTSGAASTILLGLALLWAAGPLGRLISGLETPPRPRRADDPHPPD